MKMKIPRMYAPGWMLEFPPTPPVYSQEESKLTPFILHPPSDIVPSTGGMQGGWGWVTALPPAFLLVGGAVSSWSGSTCGLSVPRGDGTPDSQHPPERLFPLSAPAGHQQVTSRSWVHLLGRLPLATCAPALSSQSSLGMWAPSTPI